VHGELERALAEEQAENGLTKAELARRLGVNRSVLTKRLNGALNMTFETLADMAWAMGRDVVAPKLVKPSQGSNRPVTTVSISQGWLSATGPRTSDRASEDGVFTWTVEP
jgi:transcriptional regulator with XRE-family HTH domain